jgi:MFS family permease
MSAFSHDTRMLIAASGLTAVSFFGIQMLLKSLYILRLDYGPEYLGLFYSFAALTFMGMGIPSGALGKRFGTRTIMLIGGLLCAIGMALLPSTEVMPAPLQYVWPFTSQIVLTIGWSMFTVNLVPALMVTTTDVTRNHAYAISSAIRELGTLIGTLIGGLLPTLFSPVLGQSLDAPSPYRISLFVGAVLALSAIIPLINVQGGQAPVERETQKARGAAPILPLLAMVLYVYVRHAGWATCQVFCNPLMDTQLHLGSATIGLISGLGQALAMVTMLILPRMMDRWSPGRILVWSTLGLGLSLVPLAIYSHASTAALTWIAVRVMSSIWITALQVFQMELVDKAWRSLAYGVVAMAMGLGFGSTSYTGGHIVAAYGYTTILWLGAVISGIATLIITLILKRRSNAEVSRPLEVPAPPQAVPVRGVEAGSD